MSGSRRKISAVGAISTAMLPRSAGGPLGKVGLKPKLPETRTTSRSTRQCRRRRRAHLSELPSSEPGSDAASSVASSSVACGGCSSPSGGGCSDVVTGFSVRGSISELSTRVYRSGNRAALGSEGFLAGARPVRRAFPYLQEMPTQTAIRGAVVADQRGVFRRIEYPHRGAWDTRQLKSCIPARREGTGTAGAPMSPGRPLIWGQLQVFR